MQAYLAEKAAKLSPVGKFVSPATVTKNLEAYVTCLLRFETELKRPAALVPGVALIDMGREIIRKAVDKALGNIFDRSTSLTVVCLSQVHAQVASFVMASNPQLAATLQSSIAKQKLKEEAMHDALKSATENNNNDDDDDNEDGCEGNEGGDEDEAVTAVSAAQAGGHRLDRGIPAAKELLRILKECVSLLVPLARLPMVDIVVETRAFFLRLVSSLNTVLLCGTEPEHMGPVLTPAGVSPLAHLATVADPLVFPMFFMVLSNIGRELEAVYLSLAVHHVKTAFPATKDLQLHKNNNKIFEHEMSGLLHDCKEIAHSLLQRYVSMSSIGLTRQLREKWFLCQTKKSTAAAALQVSPCVQELEEEVLRLQTELGEVFPPAATGEKEGENEHHEEKEGNRRQRDEKSGDQGGLGNLDIERLFTEKVEIFTPLAFDRTSPVVAVLKLFFHRYVVSRRFSSSL